MWSMSGPLSLKIELDQAQAIEDVKWLGACEIKIIKTTLVVCLVPRCTHCSPLGAWWFGEREKKGSN